MSFYFISDFSYFLFIGLISNLLKIPMIYYECYHISKSYNFNTKFIYIFNDMKHQALVTIVVVHVTMTTPHLFPSNFI
jgi:hypothetical protein